MSTFQDIDITFTEASFSAFCFFLSCWKVLGLIFTNIPRLTSKNCSFRWFENSAQSFVKLPIFGAVSHLTLAVSPFCIAFAVLWAVFRRVSFAWIGQDILVRKLRSPRCFLLLPFIASIASVVIAFFGLFYVLWVFDLWVKISCCCLFVVFVLFIFIFPYYLTSLVMTKYGQGPYLRTYPSDIRYLVAERSERIGSVFKEIMSIYGINRTNKMLQTAVKIRSYMRPYFVKQEYSIAWKCISWKLFSVSPRKVLELWFVE